MLQYFVWFICKLYGRLFIGFYFFNEYLNTLLFLGAMLIVLSGLISIPGQIRQLNDNNYLAISLKDFISYFFCINGCFN